MRIRLGLFFVIVLTMVGCGTSENSGQPGAAVNNSGKPRVAVSILPQKWLVEKIAGDNVEVVTLVQSGDSPATYKPTDSQVSTVMGAKAYFRIGVPFEKGPWFDAIQKANRIDIVDCREGIKLREVFHECTEDETPSKHVPHGGCCGDGKDPHIWLTPKLLKIQATTMAKTLKKIDPDNEAVYDKNLAELKKRLDKLDGDLRETLKPMKDKTFFVFHPAWGYLAEEYGMEQVAIETAGKDPSDSELTFLQNIARDVGVKVIFVQPQITGRGAAAVASAIKARTVEIDPLSPEVEKNLRRVADEISKSYH